MRLPTTKAPIVRRRTRVFLIFSLLISVPLLLNFLVFNQLGRTVVSEAHTLVGGRRGRAARQRTLIESSCKYLVIGLYWGLTNQRGSLLRGLEVARQLGCCLVAPTWYLDYDDPSHLWEVKPFDYFLDFGHFKEQARAMGVLVVNSLPPERHQACLAQLQNDRLDRGRVDLQLLQKWQQLHGVACLDAFATSVGLAWVTSEARVVGLSTQLRPSLQFRQLRDRVLESIGQSYIAIAGRIEGDFAFACEHGFDAEKTIFKAKCYVDEATVADVLERKFGVEPDTLVFIASGLPRSQFPAICYKYDCFTRQDVVDLGLPLVAEVERHTTSQAFVDFLIAEAADAFYGNVYSSFSRFLRQHNKQRGKAAGYFNPPCPAGNCS